MVRITWIKQAGQYDMTLTVIDIQYLHTLHLESPNIDDQLDIMISIAYF